MEVPRVPFDRTQARLLPLADLVMVLMWSRPASGTLRDTRVTIVTIWLAAAVTLAGAGFAVAALLMALAGRSWLWWVCAVVLVALAAGCLDLAVYGIRQRRLFARA